MKQIIVILGTIILGVWMVSTFFSSETGGSFKEQANTVVERAETRVNTLSTAE